VRHGMFHPGTDTPSVPSVDASLGLKLLPALLSVTAGSADVISFLGLGGLFTAHITGNLVIVAVHIVVGGKEPVAPMLAVPIFVMALGLTRLLVACLESNRLGSLRPLLLLQLLLLASSFVVCIAGGAPLEPDTVAAILGGMLGVSAMAVQNALTQVSLRGSPSTAVMTTNVVRFTMDVGEVLFGYNPDAVAEARGRASRTWPAIAGFAFGCCIGAVCEATLGLWALAVPSALALLAFAMTFSTERPSQVPKVLQHAGSD
jgi:uncharacterized membrane protein YoaK (UPF0700 family)